jgi:hypothetical protein
MNKSVWDEHKVDKDNYNVLRWLPKPRKYTDSKGKEQISTHQFLYSGGDWGGPYKKFWTKYCQMNSDRKKLYLKEKKEQICRFAIDIDLKKEEQEETSNLYTEEEMRESILKINQILLKHIHGLKEKDLAVVYQQKDPYIKDNTLKNGYKFLYLSFALNLEMQKYLLDILSEKIEGLDSGSVKNPWLIPGSAKDNTSGGVYKQDCVYVQKNGQLIKKDLLSYIAKNIPYEKLDEKKDVEWHLPRILSINCLKFNNWPKTNREEDPEEYKETQVCTIFTQVEEEKKDFEIKENIDWGEDVPVNILEDWLEETEGGENFQILSDYDERNRLIIQRTIKDKEVGCFVSEGRTHGNTDFSSFINGGDIFIYCFRCQKVKKIHSTFIDKTEQKGKKYEPKKLISFPSLYSNKEIDSKDVGSYSGYMKNYDVLMVASAMGTCKTENMPSLFNEYKRILIVTFRVTLSAELKKRFTGFKLYSELNSTLVDVPRLIVQVDSLWKVRGKYDLLILDEFTSTRKHLASEFLKHKRAVFSAMENYVGNVRKILVCDALLRNADVQYFKDLGKKVFVINNNYKPYQAAKCFIYKEKEKIQEMIIEELENDRKVVLATNKRKFAETVAIKIRQDMKEKKIGLITGKKDSQVIDAKDWKDYDIIIYSPKIIAGVSCSDKVFGKTFGYFCAESCDPEYASQMTFRVRTNIDNELHICIDRGQYKWLNADKKLILKNLPEDPNINKLEFKVDNYNNMVERDTYAKLYADVESRTRSGKNNYLGVYCGILEKMGCEIIYVDEKMKKKDKKEIKKENKKIEKDIRKKEFETTANALDVDEDEFEHLCQKKIVSFDEQNQIDKYKLKQIFDKKITYELLEDVYDLRKEYPIIKEIANKEKEMEENDEDGDDIDLNEIADTLEEEHKAERKSKDDIIDLIHRDKYKEKGAIVCRLLYHTGFKSIRRQKSITKNHNKLEKFFDKYQQEIETIFDMKYKKPDPQMNQKSIAEYYTRFANKILNHLKLKLSSVRTKWKLEGMKMYLTHKLV